MYIQLSEILPYKNCSHFLENVRFFLRKICLMFPYTVKYTESESDLQNTNLLYKTQQQCQNTLEKYKKKRENHKSIFLKQIDFKMVSVLWRFVWPAFGGHKILVYIIIYIIIRDVRGPYDTIYVIRNTLYEIRNISILK